METGNKGTKNLKTLVIAFAIVQAIFTIIGTIDLFKEGNYGDAFLVIVENGIQLLLYLLIALSLINVFEGLIDNTRNTHKEVQDINRKLFRSENKSKNHQDNN